MSETSLGRVYIIGEAERFSWGFFGVGGLAGLVFVVFLPFEYLGDWVHVQIAHIFLVLQHLLQHLPLPSPCSGQYTFSSLSRPFPPSVSFPGCHWRGALHQFLFWKVFGFVCGGFCLFVFLSVTTGEDMESSNSMQPPPVNNGILSQNLLAAWPGAPFRYPPSSP